MAPSYPTSSLLDPLFFFQKRLILPEFIGETGFFPSPLPGLYRFLVFPALWSSFVLGGEALASLPHSF